MLTLPLANSPTLTLAEGLVMMGWLQPILFLLPFVGWAWVVATIYDKDAARWYFKRQAWNIGHISAAALAVVVVLFTPLIFWISWPLSLLILGADLGLYAYLRNRDDRVPEAFRWSFDLEKMTAAREAKRKSKVARAVIYQIKGPAGELAAPEPETPEFDLRTAMEEYIQRAFEQRASQIDIVPAKEGVYAFSMMVDGVRSTPEALPTARAVPIINLFKKAAGLDVTDVRKQQTGDFSVVRLGEGTAPKVPVRISTSGRSGGMVMSMLVDPAKQVNRRIDDLGLLPNQLEDLKALIAERKGVVLLTAPADQGRTSTLYALVRAHDAYTSNVQTLEIETQAPIEGVRQNVFTPSADGAEFATTLRSIVRRDPDAVGVSELPDEATAKEILRADHEHTRIYLGLKADSALAGLAHFIKVCGDAKAASTTVRGIIGQRLVRKLCNNCRVAFQPTPEFLKKLNLPGDVKQLYRKGGEVLIKDKPSVCPVCNGVGFFGQIGVFEVYTIREEDRALVAASDFNGLKASFRQRKQQSIQTAALSRVVLGDTSIEEVTRVTAPAQPRPAAAGAPSAGAAQPGKPAPAGTPGG